MSTKKEYNSAAHHFLRAETFCAEIISNSVAFDQIRLVSDSNFKKSFRNDIEEVIFKSDEDTKALNIDLLVNRDGIYDRLPEGIFHQTKGNSKTVTVTQMTQEFRVFKEEEKQARKFFQPLEQEFFRYSTMVEQEELNLAFGMLNGNLKKELLRFWDMPEDMLIENVRKLVQLMPWVNFIKGNLELTAKALGIILGTEVQYKKADFSSHNATESVMHMGLGDLGIDTIVGDNFWEPAVYWKFFIQDIKKNEIELYRPNGSYGKLLNQFEEIFIPLPIDVIFEFTLLQSVEVEADSVLGYSLAI